MRQCRTFISSNCTCDEEITLQSTLVMHVYFSTGMTYSEEGKGAGKSRSQPLQSRNARARAQTKREVRQERKLQQEPLNLKKKERKKETVRHGKAGEQSEKCQEKANGPSARDSVTRLALRRDRTSPWRFWKVCDFDVMGPVTSFLPITLYEVFITALSGAVD